MKKQPVLTPEKKKTPEECLCELEKRIESITEDIKFSISSIDTILADLREEFMTMKKIVQKAEIDKNILQQKALNIFKSE